jgi:Uma2 family endonuclease
VVAEHQRRVTAEEYLAFERQAEERHEFVEGIIYAMSGGTRPHALIGANVSRELGNRLSDRPCEVYAGNLRVKVNSEGDYVYPDVAIACGDIQLEDDNSDTLLNPLVVVEVLSPSTEAYDRGKKGALYRAIPSLQHHVLVAQDRVSVEVYTRQGDWWAFTEGRSLEATVLLSALDCELPLAEVYAKVQFPDASLAPTPTPSPSDSPG